MTLSLVKGEKSVTVYTDENDSDLPAYVRAFPKATRREWIYNFNYKIVDVEDEAVARAYADKYTYMAVSDITTGVKDGTVSPATVSSATAPPPVIQPVRATKESKPLVERILDGVKHMFHKERKQSPWMVFKDANDQLRVLVFYSNVFKDLHKEIISEAAHKEFVEYVDKSGNYPEFQLWHGGPDTKWAQADFVDFVDGFAVAGGYVLAGKEHIAEALANLAENDGLGVSHGFFGMKDNEGVFEVFRAFEISPLPRGAEGNLWTACALGSKELSMPFNDKKKAFLKQVGYNDAQIAAAEASASSLSDRLKEAGVEYRDAGDASVDTADIPASSLGVVVSELGNLTKALTDLTGVVTQQAKSLADVQTQFKDFEAKVGDKSVQARAEELIVSQVAGARAGAGFKASEADTTKVTEEEAATAGGAFRKDAGEPDFFDSMLIGAGLMNNPTASGGK